MSESERLTRSLLIETGLRNLAMCMGDMDVPVSTVIKAKREGKDGKTIETVVVKTVLVRERDAGAAVRQMDFLDKQLDKLREDAEKRQGQADPDAVGEAGGDYLSPAVQAKVDAMRALLPKEKETA